MDQYLERGKEVIKILINNGCEAYLIGGAVYNAILEQSVEEAEITTNATPEMIKGIFSEARVEEEKAGVYVYFYGYKFLISTFKFEEKFKDNRKPSRYHYSKNLHDDLATRDFTINAIAMSYAGKLTDAYRGFEDLKKKKIRTIGNPKIRFTESPLRMLIAIRFISELGFNLESKTGRVLKQKSKLLANLEISEMIDEIRRILQGKFFKKALKVMVSSGVYKRIPVLKYEFKRLANAFRPVSIDTILASSFIQNKDFSESWAPLCQNPERVRTVVELALAQPKGKYNPKDLFNYGLDICLEANRINNMLKKAPKRSKKIKRAYEDLPVHSVSEMRFTEKDLADLIGGKTSFSEQVYQEILYKVVCEELPNDYEHLKLFAQSTLKTFYGELPQREEKTVEIPIENTYQEEKVYDIEEPKAVPETVSKADFSNPINYASTETKEISDLQKRIEDLERQNLEIKLKSDVESLVGQNLEMLEDMNYIEGTEKILISRELTEMYRKLITKVDPRLRSLNNQNQKERTDLKNEKED